MNHLTSTKVVNLIPPQSLADSTATDAAAVVDTHGWNKLSVYASLGAAAEPFTVFKLQESVNANGTSGSDITGMIYGTSADVAGATSALPLAADANKVFCFELNVSILTKRYVTAVFTKTAAGVTEIQAIAVLQNSGPDAPATIAEQGIDGNCLRRLG